jgi:hypothetical protein
MRRLGLEQHIPAESWSLGWNVNCQAVPNAEASFRYLVPYVFNVVISVSRILEVTDGRVIFSYRKPGSARLRTNPPKSGRRWPRWPPPPNRTVRTGQVYRSSISDRAT